MTTGQPRDPGLQAERTVLSWRRTALSGTALAALYLRHGARHGWGTAVLPALVAVAALLLITAAALHRAHALRRTPVTRSNAVIRAIAFTTAAVAFSATAAMVANSGSDLHQGRVATPGGTCRLSPASNTSMQPGPSR